MPTYEYRCKKCGKTFEKLQSMSEPALKKCANPKCRGAAERLISAGAGFIFKGTGFYQTDYKKSSAPEKKSESKPKETTTPKEPASKPRKSGDKS